MRRLVVLSFFVFGLWQVSGSGYMLAKAHLSQYLIGYAWEKSLKDKKNHKPWSWADTYPVFEIAVPSMDKKSYILQGASGRNMAFSATHSQESGMPGENKTTLISGHRDSHFEYLQHLKLGDTIVAKDKNKTYTYQVSKINVVNSETQKLTIRNSDEIILTTCYPFNTLQTGGNLRYIIYAYRV